DESPTLCRWIQLDPLGFSSKDSNFYRAFRNDPATQLDPSGLKCTVCRARVYFRYSVEDLDQDVEGTPFAELSRYIAKKVNHKKKWGLIHPGFFPETGVKSKDNVAPNPAGFPAGSPKSAYFFFFVTIEFCGDCSFGLNEGGSTYRDIPSQGNDQKVK